MNITRRDALLGASAAAVVTGTATAPVTIAAALAGDPVIPLTQQLRAASAAWLSAEDTFEAACHRAEFDVCYHGGLVPVETSDGPCTWGADEIWEAAEDGWYHDRLTPKQRDAALAEIERRQREGRALRRELGLEPLWQKVELWKARFGNLHARALATPATTLRGILAKLRGFYHDDEIAQMRTGDNPDDDLPAEWAASVYRDLEHLARARRD